MTKQDFELIAAVLRETPRVEQASREIYAGTFAHTLSLLYPRFDRERFIAAALR